jgi:hypothetical protein
MRRERHTQQHHERPCPFVKGAQLSNPRKTPRLAAAIAVAACMVMAFAALGGVGLAQTSGGPGGKQYDKKVTICHKGKKTIRISKKALPAHLRHGDTVGSCASAAAKKAKKAKAAKAAKAKAAKAKAEKAKAERSQAEKAKAEKSQADKPKPEQSGKEGKGKGKGK